MAKNSNHVAMYKMKIKASFSFTLALFSKVTIIIFLWFFPEVDTYKFIKLDTP